MLPLGDVHNLALLSIQRDLCPFEDIAHTSERLDSWRGLTDPWLLIRDGDAWMES
jgi:hypothetical protein